MHTRRLIIILFILCVFFYGSFTYTENLPKKNPCMESAEVALKLFKEENRLFLFQTRCYSEGICDIDRFRELTESVNTLFERTSAGAHMCVYGSNPKVESAWE